MKRNIAIHSSVLAFMLNMILAYVAFMLCRLIFLFENWGIYAHHIGDAGLGEMLRGSLVFDTSAILYANALYALLMLAPCHLKERDGWQSVAKWVFVTFNSICAAANIADSVYFKYTGRRTTTSVFEEFANEGNIGKIVGSEIVSHWYLTLCLAAVVALLVAAYVRPRPRPRPRRMSQWVAYYAFHTMVFGLYIPLSVAGMRGGTTTAVRPITISNANQYVDRPADAALILNTPFSLFRTLGKQAFVVPNYFTETELAETYTPLHTPTDTATGRRKNVVVLIVESFGREYIGAYNENLDGGKYRGYTPFVDSLYRRSLSFDYTFCNGRKSIDGMPSILSSIPMFVEPFFLTPASMNKMSGLAGSLATDGYETAFFHGAENGSMGFQAFARATGFGKYYGRTEYDADSRFGGAGDFDGTWAIWDEPFLQFYALKMSEMREPFMAAVFTASSHHPYAIPTEYRDTFPEEGGNVIHKCIRYTDHALRRFFATASRQPWFENTIFVLTSDHTNLSDHAEYQTDLGGFCSPILLFDPSGHIAPGRRHCIAQQIDIMPTILSVVGHRHPYIAFGKDLTTTPDEETWAVNYYNGVYQYVWRDLLLQFDGNEVKALYDIKSDWMLTTNIRGTRPDAEAQMLRHLRAIIQQYMECMTEDRIHPDTFNSRPR